MPAATTTQYNTNIMPHTIPIRTTTTTNYNYNPESQILFNAHKTNKDHLTVILMLRHPERAGTVAEAIRHVNLHR